MGTALAELVIGLVELLETESARLQRRVIGLAAGVGLAFAAGLLVLIGLAWLAWAGFTALCTVLLPSAAAALIGLACLGIAGGMLWKGSRN
jgi:hypothetical protein